MQNKEATESAFVQHQAEFLRVSAHAQRKWETSKQADEQVGNKQTTRSASGRQTSKRTSEPYEQCEQTKRESKHAATHRRAGMCACCAQLHDGAAAPGSSPQD
jgi:hypothetical protein